MSIPLSKSKPTACTSHKVSRVSIAYKISVIMISALYNTAAAKPNRYNILFIQKQQSQWATDCPTQSGASSLNVFECWASCKIWGITMNIYMKQSPWMTVDKCILFYCYIVNHQNITHLIHKIIEIWDCLLFPQILSLWTFYYYKKTMLSVYVEECWVGST